MPIYTPTIITGATPYLQITMAGSLSYEELLQVLGSWNFKVKTIYVSAQRMSQVLEVMQYNHLNSNGNNVVTPIVPSPDPYQNRPALVIATAEKNIILDGFSALNYNIQAGEQILMVLDTDEVSNSAMLDALHLSNIKQVLTDEF